MKILTNLILALTIFSYFISCSPTKASFHHKIDEGPTPWNSEEFNVPNNTDHFTFAIISDLNGGEREGVYSTAVAQINRLDPEFVLSVGDLIDGGTEDENQLQKEWDFFDQRTSRLNMPFFHLGGNHDLTNPVMRKFWNERYGPRYYHFTYNDVLFIMMDSEDYEEKRMVEIYEARAHAIKILDGKIEGEYPETEYYKMKERTVGAMSQEQLQYFTQVLNEHPKVRWIFVLMHKPLWMREDEKGLGPLEQVLNGRSYTVINGHFHSYQHQTRNGMNYIILGTTGGSQRPDDPNAFDHITLVRMKERPIITNLKMDGILNEQGLVTDK